MATIDVPVTISDKEVAIRVPDSTLQDAVYAAAIDTQVRTLGIVKPDDMRLRLSKELYDEFVSSTEYQNYVSNVRDSNLFNSGQLRRIYGFPATVVDGVLGSSCATTTRPNWWEYLAPGCPSAPVASAYPWSSIRAWWTDPKEWKKGGVV